MTDKHTAAKEQLKRVAGGISVGTARMTEKDAQKQLASACQLLLKPCEPRDDRSSSTIAENRNAFQGKGESGAHCYCGKKAASNACSFTGPAFSEALKSSFPLVYEHFVNHPNQTTRLVGALSKELGLTVPIADRKSSCQRNRHTVPEHAQVDRD